MTQINHEQALRDALEEFETALDTPVISGDLAQWAAYLESAWQQLAVEVTYHLRSVFPEQMDQIAREDSELLGRVEQLRADSEEIRQQVESIGEDVARLAEKARRIEPHENRVEPELQSIFEAGTQFVRRVHRHVVAVNAWLMEALNRERGPGD